MSSDIPPVQSVTTSEIETIISQNQGIANVSALREELLKRVPLPITWQIENRQAHLRPFAPFFKQIMDPDSPNVRMRSLVRDLSQAKQDIRPIPSVFDLRFNDPSDMVVPLFEIIFQDQEMLAQWMRLLDAHVEGSSRANLEAMDEAKRKGNVPVRKDVVLVGGGPLTSLLASILGPYFRVTVITMQRGLGKPWRIRKGIRLNSSCSIRDFNGPPLPRLAGPTTRVIASQQWNSLDVDTLLGIDSLTITCDDGSTVEYVVGARLGDLVATDTLFHADDFLIQQWIDISQLQRNEDGSLRLTLVDTQDGAVRQLDAAAVFLLTGPGPEQSKVASRTTQRLYQALSEQIDLVIREARIDLAIEREILRLLEATCPPGEVLQLKLCRERTSREVTRIARAIQRKVPHVLTLTMIEKLYDVWDELEELGADPAAFPFAELLTGEKSIAYIGNGDTARTLKEWAEDAGPACATPQGFKRTGTRRGTIYNESATSPEEYASRYRPRYAGIFTRSTRSIPFKASGYRLTYDRRNQPRVEVTHRNADGRRSRLTYDYAFDATGLSRQLIEEQLPATFHRDDIQDLEGNMVARGDPEANLFIVGTATGRRTPDFPQEIQAILQALGVGENTISLWVNGLLAERLGYSYIATRSVTKPEPQRDR